MTSTAEQPFSIKTISENTGILSKKTADLYISKTTWKLISTLDLQPHLDRGNILKDNIILIQNKCIDKCEFKEQISILLDRVLENQQYLLEIVNTLQTTDRKRSKRAIFSTIGKIYKLLYGTLVEEDEIFLTQKLQTSLNSTSELANLMKQQTEIIQLNNLLITQKFTNTDKILKKIFDYQETHNQRHLIEKAYHSLMEATFQYEIDSKILIDAILIAAGGKFHPKIIQEKLFWESKKSLSESRAKFPFPNKNLTISEVLSISKITIVYINKKLIYILDIPLIEPIPFKIFQLWNIPVPQITDSEDIIFSYIPLKSNNIALSRSDLQFIPVPRETLEKCKKIQSSILCDFVNPIFDISNNTECEIRLVARMPVKLSDCNPVLTKLNNTQWIRLSKITWAFAAPKKEIAYIACGENPILKAEIHNTGLLTLKPNCMAKTNTVQFSTDHKFSSSQKIRTYNNPSLNITKILHNLITNVTRNNVYDFIQNNSLTNFNQKEIQLKLNDIISKATELSKTKKIILPSTNFNLFSNLFDETTSAILIIVGIIICIVIFRK